jgi:alkanesulfonate monooxygenase SsuD/methylene tetrahydromethanopterin reductase-like flavin-dependent oxidoreductase (luciferase family)
VLLNWMLPAQAAMARRWVLEGAEQAGRAAPLVASYVRVALGTSARQRLRDEESHYRTINQAHRQHFEAMDARSAPSELLRRHDPKCSKDWRPTTLRWSYRSPGCSQNRARPRCAPPPWLRRRERPAPLW